MNERKCVVQPNGLYPKIDVNDSKQFKPMSDTEQKEDYVSTSQIVYAKSIFESAKQAVKLVWETADEFDDGSPHVMLCCGHGEEPHWIVSNLRGKRATGEDILEVISEMYPDEEVRKKREIEAKKEELLRCENRANELRKELEGDL